MLIHERHKPGLVTIKRSQIVPQTLENVVFSEAASSSLLQLREEIKKGSGLFAKLMQTNVSLLCIRILVKSLIKMNQEREQNKKTNRCD